MAAKLEWVHSFDGEGDKWEAGKWRIRASEEGTFFVVSQNSGRLPSLADAKAWCQQQEDAAHPAAPWPQSGEVWGVVGKPGTWRKVVTVDVCVRYGCFSHGMYLHEMADWNRWLKESGAVRIDGDGARVQELERQLNAGRKIDAEIEQILGKALGYPKYADDQKNFPGSTGDDVCVGEHVAASLASEAAARVAALEAEVIRLRRSHADLEKRAQAAVESHAGEAKRLEAEVVRLRANQCPHDYGLLKRTVEGLEADNEDLRDRWEKVVKERDELRAAPPGGRKAGERIKYLECRIREIMAERNYARTARDRLMEALRGIEKRVSTAPASWAALDAVEQMAREAIKREEGVKA